MLDPHSSREAGPPLSRSGFLHTSHESRGTLVRSAGSMGAMGASAPTAKKPPWPLFSSPRAFEDRNKRNGKKQARRHLNCHHEFTRPTSWITGRQERGKPRKRKTGRKGRIGNGRKGRTRGRKGGKAEEEWRSPPQDFLKPVPTHEAASGEKTV